MSGREEGDLVAALLEGYCSIDDETLGATCKQGIWLALDRPFSSPDTCSSGTRKHPAQEGNNISSPIPRSGWMKPIRSFFLSLSLAIVKRALLIQVQ